MILLSFAVAFALSIVPLPDAVAPLRPEWVVLVLVYWCMALPERVGVGAGWVTGLLLDVLRGGLLGQHALTLAIVAWLTLQLYQRLRVFPAWQQAASVFVIVLVHLTLQLWIKGISGAPDATWQWFLPAVTSALVWPLVFIVLRAFRRGFRIA